MKDIYVFKNGGIVKIETKRLGFRELDSLKKQKATLRLKEMLNLEILK